MSGFSLKTGALELIFCKIFKLFDNNCSQISASEAENNFQKKKEKIAFWRGNVTFFFQMGACEWTCASTVNGMRGMKRGLDVTPFSGVPPPDFNILSEVFSLCSEVFLDINRFL